VVISASGANRLVVVGGERGLEVVSFELVHVEVHVAIELWFQAQRVVLCVLLAHLLANFAAVATRQAVHAEAAETRLGSGTK